MKSEVRGILMKGGKMSLLYSRMEESKEVLSLLRQGVIFRQSDSIRHLSYQGPQRV